MRPLLSPASRTPKATAKRNMRTPWTGCLAVWPSTSSQPVRHQEPGAISSSDRWIAAWNAWWAEADAEELGDFGSVLRRVVRSLIISGEAFVLLPVADDGALRLRLLDPIDLLSTEQAHSDPARPDGAIARRCSICSIQIGRTSLGLSRIFVRGRHCGGLRRRFGRIRISRSRPRRPSHSFRESLGAITVRFGGKAIAPS